MAWIVSLLYDYLWPPQTTYIRFTKVEDPLPHTAGKSPIIVEDYKKVNINDELKDLFRTSTPIEYLRLKKKSRLYPDQARTV